MRLLVSLALLVALPLGHAFPASADDWVAPAGMRVEALGFVANGGQWAEDVRFVARKRAAEVTVRDDGLSFRGAEGVVTVRWPRKASARGQGELAVRTSYFLPAGRASGVASFERVRLTGVGDGVDMVVRADGDAFAYDIVLAPGAVLEAVRFTIEGASAAAIGEDGALRLTLPGGVIEHRIGACWQVDPESGATRPIDVRHLLLGSEDGAATIGFEAPARDAEQALVIDPTLAYCTYLGTSGPEEPVDVAVDAQGNAYVLGRVGPLMPTTPGAFQAEGLTWPCLWVAKLARGGTSIEWATFLDGSNTEQGTAIAVDGDGSVVVVGATWSANFPLLETGHKTALTGLSDTFVARLDPSGQQLLGSTLFGGNGHDVPDFATLLPDGSVAIAVMTLSSDVHATPGAFETVKGSYGRLIVRLSPDLSDVVFATWFPIMRVTSMVSDEAGHVFLTGDAKETQPAPVTEGAYQTQVAGFTDAAIAKLDASGSHLHWCTYVGGSGPDSPWGLALDPAGCVYVVGQTAGSFSDFPTTAGAFANLPSPSGNAFATKLLADGSALVWSSYIGGGGGGGGHLYRAAVDGAGHLITAGSQNQPGWPTTPDAHMPQFEGPFPSGDVVFTKFDAFGAGLVYSTFVGGNGTDYFPKLALDAFGRAHVAYYSSSTNLPTTPGAIQPTHAGPIHGPDIAIAAFDLPVAPWRVVGGQSDAAPHVPNLSAMGSLEPGTLAHLRVRGGAPGGDALLVIGFAALDLPLPELGASLHPWPHLLLPVTLGPQGELDLAFPALDAAVDLHFQLVGFHPAAPGGLYASNGLHTAR